MPIRFNWEVNINQILWLLVLIAVIVGIIFAFQSNNYILIEDLKKQQDILAHKLDVYQQTNATFQSEQRQTLLDLSNKLTAIQLQQGKRK